MSDRTSEGNRGRWVTLFVVLLLAATAAFVLGVALERNEGHRERAATAQSSSHAERTEGSESAENGSTAEAERGSDAGSEELILGIDPESTAALTAAVVLSVLLAGLVWWRPATWMIATGAGFSAGAAALDVREVARQLGEGNNRVAAVAIVVAGLHLGAAASAFAAVVWRRRTGRATEARTAG
jgi:hypothetical protein